ncbi:MAG: gliding motility-associated ABC transporter permease subunit GldF [Cytophagaceae bacterium]|nr:gliding motility-associated ABC transporter permease subunit GldF [Cytophagaceae bacterium]
MFTVFLKEINTFFNSLIAYIVMTVFLTGTGLFMWVFRQYSVLDYGFADMSTLFSMAPFVFMFLIPAITMRTFAEEKKDGTIELLLTKPLTDWQIIIGKYLSSLTLVVFSLIPTLIYYYSVYKLGDPEGNIDSAAVTGSYTGLFLLGAVFTSMGIFSSVISGNQIVSFVVALVLCYIVYQGFFFVSSINAWGEFSTLIDQFGISYHYDALSKGLIDSRDVLYFLSVITIMLLLTKLILGSRKW